jgi:hypothetical protein
MPIFVLAADAALVRTQLGVNTEPARLPSIPSLPHVLRVRVPNDIARAASGKVTLRLPERWRVVSARTVPIDLPATGEASVTFQVRLPLDGASGRQPLRLEFEMSGEPPRRFTVYREIEVGLGDVELTASARLDDRGNLVVRQQLANHGSTEVSFSCQLSIPGRRPQRVTLRLPDGAHEHVYTVPNGQELLGKTLRLRADEVGGQRVLSQSITP